MVNVVAELSKYIILTFMLIYTFQGFSILRVTSFEKQRSLRLSQFMLVLLMESVAFAVLYLQTEEFQMIVF